MNLTKGHLIQFTVVVGFISYCVTMLIDGIMKLESYTIATAILCFVWLSVVHIYKDVLLSRNKAIERKTLNELKCMDPFEFERYVADLYRSLGYWVKQTKKTGDGGKDIIAKKDGQIYFIECKRYNSPIGFGKMRDFIGACTLEGNHIKGIYVTTSTFTSDAIAAANRRGIELIDGNRLISIINSQI